MRRVPVSTLFALLGMVLVVAVSGFAQSSGTFSTSEADELLQA